VERLGKEFGFRPIGVLDAIPALVRQAAAARGGTHRAAS
jgi:hypothetical protein